MLSVSVPPNAQHTQRLKSGALSNTALRGGSASQLFDNPSASALRFGSETPVWTYESSLERGMGAMRDWLSQVGQKLIAAWDHMTEMLENWMTGLQRFFAPTVPQLQQALLPLIKQSSTGFPTAMLRASLIASGSPDAALGYQALQAKYAKELPEVQPLLERFVDSESDAYLTAHIMALETAIKTPERKMQMDLECPTTLRVGVEDANAVVRRRVNQPFYGKDNHGVADSLYNLILASPKVTLHEHYRGCTPMALIRAKFIQQGHSKAYKSNDTLENHVRVDRPFSQDGRPLPVEASLETYRQKYDQVSAAIFSNETAYLGAYMYTLRAGLENVRYFEYRLNPISSFVKDPIALISGIQQGIDDARAFLLDTKGQKLDANLIVAADRQPKDSMEIKPVPGQPYDSRVELALEVLEVGIKARQQNLRVTGFDICGDEANYAITDFKPVADRLRAYNQQMKAENTPHLRIGATLHAGETPYSGLISQPNQILSGPESIRKSIELFWDQNTPVRIGHGVRVINDLKLINECRRKNIGFEQCPKSNNNTQAVGKYHDMPALTLSRDHGLKVSISCDNRTVSKTNACNELVKLARYVHARHEDRRKFQFNGIETAFIFDEAQRQAIQSDMTQAYEALENTPEYQSIIEQEKDPERFQELVENRVIPVVAP